MTADNIALRNKIEGLRQSWDEGTSALVGNPAISDGCTQIGEVSELDQSGGARVLAASGVRGDVSHTLQGNTDKCSVAGQGSTPVLVEFSGKVYQRLAPRPKESGNPKERVEKNPKVPRQRARNAVLLNSVMEEKSLPQKPHTSILPRSSGETGESNKFLLFVTFAKGIPKG